MPRFAYDDQAQVAEVSGSGDGTKLGTGFVRMTDAAIAWTVNDDEIILVLDGEITVETDDGDLTAKPKDCIWLAKGTELVYRAENALVFYAIHPASRAGEKA